MSIIQLEKLYSIKEVSTIVAMGKSTIWEHIRKGVFPKPVKRGRSSLWPSSSIAEYIEQVKDGAYHYIPTEKEQKDRVIL